MIVWIRVSLFFIILILITGVFIAEPVIKDAQAKIMLTQMEASSQAETSIYIGHQCKSCVENPNIEHCSNLCTAATLAISDNKSFKISIIPSEPSLLTSINMFEYTPSVELTPPRT